MFGSSAAFNLNSSLYDWASSAPSVFIYFKTEDSSSNTATASNFAGGTVALTGGTGIVIGAIGTLLISKKRKENA